MVRDLAPARSVALPSNSMACQCVILHARLLDAATACLEATKPLSSDGDLGSRDVLVPQIVCRCTGYQNLSKAVAGRGRRPKMRYALASSDARLFGSKGTKAASHRGAALWPRCIVFVSLQYACCAFASCELR